LNSEVDVLIVGGGAAGIGAARRLAASGFTTRVLEASARLGGRACTHEIAGLPLDLGCGWLHSADRNGWVRIARERHIDIDRSKAAWGVQFRNLDFPPAEQAEAWSAFDAWTRRLSKSPPPSDCAADALDPGDAYCRLDGVIPGLVLYDDRGTDCGGWVPLSTPGQRTEYQGVELVEP